MQRLSERWGRRLWMSLTPDVLDSFKTPLLHLCTVCLSSRGVTWTLWYSKSKVGSSRKRIYGNMRLKGCKLFPLSFCGLIVSNCCTLMALAISFLPPTWLVLFRNEACTRKLSMYLCVRLPSFPFNNFGTDRNVLAAFDKEHQVSNILCSKKLWENSGLGGRQKGAEGQAGIAQPTAALCGSPRSQGWLGRILVHRSEPLVACSASCILHVRRGEGSLQSGIRGTQRGSKNLVRKGSREDGGLLLCCGVCGRGNCRTRSGFIADVGVARWRDVGHRSVGSLTSFLHMDMEQHVGCNVCNFAQFLEAVVK